MSVVPVVTKVDVENFVFPPVVTPPASGNTLFLGGAGVRGLYIEGEFKKFTAIGVYLEGKAVPLLAAKWSGRTPEELATSDEFFRDIVTGPFERLTQVSFITHLAGQEYMRKVSENCIAFWKSVGAYTDAEAKAIKRMIEIVSEENFPPGSSIFLNHLINGSYVISYSKDTTIPKLENAVIQSNELGEAVLETIIGKNGVSAAARQSLAARLAPLMMEINDTPIEDEKERMGQRNERVM